MFFLFVLFFLVFSAFFLCFFATIHRSGTMRISYLGQDRADVQEAAKLSLTSHAKSDASNSCRAQASGAVLVEVSACCSDLRTTGIAERTEWMGRC